MKTLPRIGVGRSQAVVGWFLLGWLLLIAGPMVGQEGEAQIHHSRGLSVASAYQIENLDAVNLYSGNLTLTVPLGKSYPIGGGFDYGFSLQTNSNVWRFETVFTPAGTWETVAEPDLPLSNAGLGWHFGFGRLWPPGTPGINDSGNFWVLIEADGSRRIFFGDPHQPLEMSQTAGSVGYTQDGSYLRMKILASGEREVESPGGTVRVFRADGRIRQIRDRFNNQFNIAYDLNFLTWTMTDSRGRSHVATFEGDPTDPEVVFAKKRKRLKTLDLAAFAGSRAIYQFTYVTRAIPRHQKDSSSTSSATVQVSLLSSLAQPDGSTYAFTYIESDADRRNTFENGGQVRSLTLPTGSIFEWEYYLYTFPSNQDPGSLQPNPWGTGEGVRFKRRFNLVGSPSGTWQYEQGPRPPTQTSNFDLREVRTWVTTPLGDVSVHYFQNGSGGFSHGLPYTELLTDATGTRFLSEEVFDGTPSTSNHLRSTYLRYTADRLSVGNPRVTSKRTVYHDDGGRFADVSYSKFDGLGHYRETTTGGNFGSGDVRTLFTNYNPNRGTYSFDAVTGTYGADHGFTNWPTSSPWVLNTWTETTATEGGITAKSQTCFEAATGFLLRERVMRSTSPTSTDLLRVRTRDASGNLIRVRHYGGDLQALSTSSNLCGLGVPATDQYRTDHTYQNGVLATSQYLTSTGGTLGFKHVDRTIDLNTGLPLSTRDIAGLQTEYEYDALGRPTWIKPLSGNRDGWTELIYTPWSAVGKANVVIQQRGNGAKTRPVLGYQQVVFDGFGRVTVERDRLPSGADGVRQTWYNGMDLKTRVSEQYLAGQAVPWTIFNNYDPFGRPRQIVPPDGSAHAIDLIYNGVRSQTRRVRLGTSRNISGVVVEAAVDTNQLFDRQGRLWKVTEDSGAGGTPLVTEYFYDVGSRLARVRQARSEGTQNRYFNYDRRGFLVSEQHPEKGTTGNGFVSYLSYDPLGHAHRTIDGPSDLTFTFDRAERLTQVRESTGLARVLLSQTYATTGGFSDKRLGKLVSATRHNYHERWNVDFDVVESFTYAGREGRVSQKVTTLNSGLDNYTQNFSWDELGLLSWQTYPFCGQCPAGTAPNRTVSYTYTQGRLTSIPGYATSLTYHPSGTVNQITHGNGVVSTQAEDPNHLARPASISVKLGSTTLFSTGTYGYDGSGNIIKMGSDSAVYDRYGRLVDGTVFQAGASRKQTYGFDGFGNLISTTTWVSGFPSTRTQATVATTNHLSAAAYDAAGSQLTWGSYSYTWDQLHLLKAYQGGGNDRAYAYTVDGERILAFDATTGTSTFRLRDLGGKVVREFRYAGGAWSWQRDWIHRDGQVLATEAPGTEGRRYLHSDHLGTPRVITTASGSIAATNHYYPFGEWAGGTGSTLEPLRFTGHERDDNVGGTTDDLDYMHARYYGTQVGRFLSFDPVAGDPVLPISWNKYAYVSNNPLNYFDPDGRRQNPVTGSRGIDPIPKRGVKGKIRSRKSNPSIGLFGKTRKNKNGNLVFHSGIDINAGTGTPVFAAESGVVTDIGVRGAGGNRIQITTANGTLLTFAHLDSFTNSLSKGSVVIEGTEIGRAGTTGNATTTDPDEEHVHFTVKDPSGNHVDPVLWLNDASASEPLLQTPDLSGGCSCTPAQYVQPAILPTVP